MAAVEELLRSEVDGSVSFGNHRLTHKAKLEDFRRKAGTVVYECSREFTAEQAYRIYEDRWLIEEMFRMYKHITELDSTRVHSDLSDMGTCFVNFLSTLITSRILRRLADTGVTGNMPFKEAMETLSRALKFREEDGTWKYRSLMEKEKDALRKLGLMPQLPPKRGPGRPPKNSRASVDST